MCRHDYGSQEVPRAMAQRPGNQGSQCQFQLEVKGKRQPTSQLISVSREWILSCSAFCSIQAFNRLDEACRGGGQSSLLGLPMWMLTSSRKVEDTRHWHTVVSDQISGHSVAQSGWYTKLTIAMGVRFAVLWVTHIIYIVNDTHLMLKYQADAIWPKKDGGPRTPFETFGMNGNRKTGR